MLITLLGAGHVATQLGQAMLDCGHTFNQVYSRTASAAALLAGRMRAEPVFAPEAVTNGSDLYVCALKDDALETVLKRLNLNSPTLVHTSGSLPLSVLAAYAPAYGVLYPLQTFSKTRTVDVARVPIFLEASDEKTLDMLTRLAGQLSRTVHVLSSDDRAELHLAAVFACNFVNHLYGLAGDILNRKQLPFEYLLPLIDETAAKVHEMDPDAAQTGPAVRYDNQIIGKHLGRLAENPELAQIYRILTDSIFNRIHHT